MKYDKNNLKEGIDYFIEDNHLRFADHVTEVGDDFLENNTSIKSIDGNNLTTAGNYFLYSNESAIELSFPNLTTVGNSFLCWNESAKLKTKTYDFKIITKDRLKFVIESKRSKGGIDIYKGFILNSIANDILNKRDGYLVVSGEYSSHGDTLKKALEDLNFKVNSERLKKEPIKKDTIITIQLYRIITGSCEAGVKNWMETNKVKENIKAVELLPILERTNAYGLQTFKKLITF